MSEEMMAEVQAEGVERVVTAEDIRSMVYSVRGKQVMLDSDLAKLYGVETGALNRQAKRNEARFPADFRFQLSKEEMENLKCQFGISSLSTSEYGGRRTLPYAYTEQGVSMLASVLKSAPAIRVSVDIMRAFVEMRKFIANNAALFDRISSVELKQVEYQKKTDAKLDQIFEYIDSQEESSQKLFFDGQIYDAFSFLIELIASAESSILLIDGYVDVYTLNLLAKKQANVPVKIYTFPKTRLTLKDVNKFNEQYPMLEVHYTKAFHDRFLLLDEERLYHIGASLKDAGKKCFAVSLMEDAELREDLLVRLEA